jgi:hypothetical protein
MEEYKKDYEAFVSEFEKGHTTGEDVGVVVAKMAQYFSMWNTELVNAYIIVNKKASEIEQTVDDNGKPMSHSKAEVLTNATDEYSHYLETRGHIQNIEQYINALKALQKGVLNEYGHMGSM